MRAIDARAKRLPLEVTVDADPELAGRRFDRAIEGAAYFVASEALGQHRQARRRDGGDGRPGRRRRSPRRSASATTVAASATTSCAGSGLTNMADRAAALGGRVTVEANPAGGTTVVAELPLAPTVAVVTLRVVIAEDNKVYREGVRAVLEFGGEFEVVAAVDRPEALLAAGRRAAARRRHHRHPDAADAPHGGHRGRPRDPPPPPAASASSCCPSTPTTATPSSCSRTAPPGSATSSRSASATTTGRSPGRVQGGRRRAVGDRSRGRRRAGVPPGEGPLVAAAPADRSRARRARR